MFTETEQRNLLGNHLKFLETHRGRVEQRGDSFLILSDKEDFHFAILGKSASLDDYSQRFKTIYLPPWSNISENDLDHRGFKERNGLNYMVLKKEASEWKANKNVGVSIVQNTGDMEIFSEVQAKGFADSEEDFLEWHPWIHQANLKNLHNTSQFFYIGRLNQQPAGVTLTVHYEGMTGIYAVATLEQFRKQGISTTIMKQAVQDALKTSVSAILLQVRKDSYAESFYTHLGFETAFHMRIYSHS